LAWRIHAGRLFPADARMRSSNQNLPRERCFVFSASIVMDAFFRASFQFSSVLTFSLRDGDTRNMRNNGKQRR
jgi:hypothetical protein